MNKLKKQNLILIGFMGCGKSTIGRILARDFGYTFVDTDAMIEEREGMLISEIFSQHGEQYFRCLETELIKELNQSLDNAVISTGGGLPVQKENAKLLLELGCVVFLKISKEEVLERLKDDGTRPLLQGESVEDKVRLLLQERTPKYEQVSHWTVGVDQKTIDQVVKKVKNCYLTSHYPKKRVDLQ